MPNGYKGDIPLAAFEAIEQEMTGIMHGTISLVLFIKDGHLARFTTNRERSFIPGKPMTGDAAEKEQEERREASPYEGPIIEFINREVPDDWETWKLDARRAYWRGAVQGTIKTVPRDRVCTAEVWCEALGGLSKDLNKSITRDINSVIERTPGWVRSIKPLRHGPHGTQRGFVRSEKR